VDQTSHAGAIADARARLATTVLDPTLRQLQAELCSKEQAAVLADRALEAVAAELGRLRARIAQLEQQLDALDAPARVRTVPASEVLEWETVAPGAPSGNG
jgi:ABC-type phosphate transport system auxiliary subunit